MFDNDQLLEATGWTRQTTDDGSYYKGEFSALVAEFYSGGASGFDIGSDFAPGDVVWLKVTYEAQDASYKQNAFFGFDNSTASNLWGSSFPVDKMNSRLPATVSGFSRYTNGMFPMCGQSSYYYFHNSSNQAKNAINVYKFYGTII